MTFSDFFFAIHGYMPFPWQQMLVDREAWPDAIDLPTASGKTACIDAAIYRLAIGKPMPRRIWFVVDRRIVVDEAHERAKRIAKALSDDPALNFIADALRAHGNGKCPLAVARLRGGAWRDDSGWSRDPRQPAVICSTVDQLGSSLLFRPYNHGANTASIYAGLAGNDSLIILDEAHCSQPFRQTLTAISRFRKAPWCSEPIPSPFKFTIMSATLPTTESEEQPAVDVFPSGDDERCRALDHERLNARASATKTATLRFTGNKTEKDDPLVKAVVEQAKQYQTSECKRIAVMVNRVNTAKEIYQRIASDTSVDAVLLTGRMRPLDRDALVELYSPLLKSGSGKPLDKPIVLITTQCLEVGADFSFDALITECASLDALRQRFGRLDRLGEIKQTQATILIREADTKVPEDKADDPIYGKAIANTWLWLNEIGTGKAAATEPTAKKKTKSAATSVAEPTVDFGIHSLGNRIAIWLPGNEDRFEALLAPRLNAPILLPAHLDLLCQTSPPPSIEPEVSLFLHGSGRRDVPEVQVVFRIGLNLFDEVQVEESLRLMPPTSPECLSLPLYRLRKWLASPDSQDTSGDVEGEAEPGVDSKQPNQSNQFISRRFVIWRGKDSIKVTEDSNLICPQATVILSAEIEALRRALAELGQPQCDDKLQIDRAEQAQQCAKGRVALRVSKTHLEALQATNLGDALLKLIGEGNDDRSDWREALSEFRAAVEAQKSEEGRPASDDWLVKSLEHILQDFRVFTIGDPFTEVVIVARQRVENSEEDTGTDDEDEERSRQSKRKEGEAISLAHHTADVCAVAYAYAKVVLSDHWANTFHRAAFAHDWGKLDHRFQVMLHGGDVTQVDPHHPLAKSAAIHAKVRNAELPGGWEHAMLSMQIAKHSGYSYDDAELHLIASHHGSARPFAAIVRDRDASSVDLGAIECPSLTHDQRQNLTPAYDLSSQVANRFWRLIRKYGWWGEAYLESVFRLADWEASRAPVADAELKTSAHPAFRQPCDSATCEIIEMDGLDGSNPLGFLAALGTFRLVSSHEPAATMAWNWRKGAFRPFFNVSARSSKEDFCQRLLSAGQSMDRIISSPFLDSCANAGPIQKTGKRGWQDKLCFPLDLYRKESARRLEQADVEACAWLPALCGDCRPEWDKETKQQLARWTRLDFTAANQAFIAMLRGIKSACRVEDLLETLFVGPHYKPLGMSMRWDPLDEKRQYAVMDVNPAPQAQNALTDLGANFLAIEALPLFPLVPDARASQPCFTDSPGGLGCLQWALWHAPVSFDAARSFLTASAPPPSGNENARQFSSNIVMPAGYFRSFTASRPI